jgi:hypothetical protein
LHIEAAQDIWLKEVMEKENLNWRSFADDGTISRDWNSPATLAFYVLDHKGVIRHKWIGHPGEKAIDSALEKLIQEAEK